MEYVTGDVRMNEVSMKANRKISTWTIFILCIVLVASACLDLCFPDREQQPKSVRLARFVSYSYNGDCSEYVKLVVTFPAGLKHSPARVLRPLYPAVGVLVYQPLRALKPLLPEDFCRRAAEVMAKNGGDKVWGGMDVRDVVLAWAALIIVNFALYLASLMLIVYSLRQLFSPDISLLLAMYAALHRDVVDYLLLPSAEPFALLLPAILLYTAVLLWPSRRSGYATALGIGIGMLGKAAAFIIVNWLYEHLFVRNWRSGWRRAALCSLLFAVPVTAYVGVLHIAGIAARNHELEDHHFAWMVEYARGGKIDAIPMQLLTEVESHLLGVAIDWAVPLLMICGLLVFRKDIQLLRIDRAFRRHLITYTLCAAAFWVLYGLAPHRHDICYYLPILVALGTSVTRKLARPHALLLFGLLAQAIIFAVVNSFF